MSGTRAVQEYIAGFPPDVRERLERIRDVILENVPHADEKMRYGIAAVMLGGRYALHYAGWKKHIGLYPVPAFEEPLESEIAPYRSAKDSITFPHNAPIPYELIGAVTRAIVARRGADQSDAG